MDKNSIIRTAICFSGELRSIDKTYSLFESIIFSKLEDYDIFFFTWNDDPDLNKKSILIDTGKVKGWKLENRKTFDLDNLFPLKPANIPYQYIPRQLYGLQQSNNLKKEFEEQNGFKYDLVIRIRPDLLLIKDSIFNTDIDFNKFNTLNHDNWHGYCDRFYITNSYNADLISDGIDLLSTYSLSGGREYGEAFLMFLVHYYGMESHMIDNIYTCILRNNGDKDGELILSNKGIIHKTDNGIWHNEYKCYI